MRGVSSSGKCYPTILTIYIVIVVVVVVTIPHRRMMTTMTVDPYCRVVHRYPIITVIRALSFLHPSHDMKVSIADEEQTVGYREVVTSYTCF